MTKITKDYFTDWQQQYVLYVSTKDGHRLRIVVLCRELMISKNGKGVAYEMLLVMQNNVYGLKMDGGSKIMVYSF